ncbi:MAG: caspase family protein [Hyphomicrobiales bacterium]|nr:caspase family protein [Hyphomicrobiales bacterium]
MGVLARFAFCLAFALGITLATQSSALADRRIALVIGNGKYENAGVLANPVNDADAVADLLTKAGFDSVDRRRDLGVVEFKRAVREFVDRAANADVAVVYYSGHGLEIGGVNYLIPVDAKLMSVLDMEDEAVSLDRVLAAAGHVKKLSLIILDACRENPFHPAADAAGVTRGVSMGLAGVGPTVADTLIAFAAKAGSVSYDGDGRNSPFTTALLKYITQPGLDIRLALGKVRDDVLRATNHRQEPYVYGSLGGENVALVPAPEAPSVAAVPPAAPSVAAIPPPPARDADEADYRTAERAASLDGWRAFLAAHPDGSYARLARAEIDKLLARQKDEAARTEAAALSPDQLCERDEDRLVRLRANPTSEEAAHFASELSCEKLRPQLSRLMESLGFAMPAPAAPARANSPPAAQMTAERKPVSDCGSEQAELDGLRANPSIDAAQAFWHGLRCERLRPQARMLMYSLDLTPEEPSAHPLLGDASPTLPPKANDVRAVVAPGDSAPEDPGACQREKEELDRLRANPDRRDAERFAKGITCAALKPQAARLLESLTD